MNQRINDTDSAIGCIIGLLMGMMFAMSIAGAALVGIACELKNISAIISKERLRDGK